MKAVLLFEDIDDVVRHFVGSHLQGALNKEGKIGDVRIKYVPYLGQDGREREPEMIAREAADWLRDLGDEVESFAFCFDLSPDLSPTPDTGFGLRVIREVASSILGETVHGFLLRKNVLCSVLSSFPEKVHRCVPREWSSITTRHERGAEILCFKGYAGEGASEIQDLRIFYPPASIQERNLSREVETMLDRIRRDGTSLVVCDRGHDCRFLADLIARWL